jgi:hypothetical protein
MSRATRLGTQGAIETAPEVSMLARPTLTRPAQEGASKPKTQARPAEERFLLKVDGQIKCSFVGKTMRRPPGRR